MPTLPKLYTMQEAAQHSTREDCWAVIDGKVYDVTKYLDDHPGDDVPITTTGWDSTEKFEVAGSCKVARKLMKDYCIGEIYKTHVNVISELEIFTKEEPSSFSNRFPSMLYWALPAAIVAISAVATAVIYSRKK